MSVYVDNARNKYRGMLMCHMLADTEAELFAMADKIGVARRHFQGKASFPHFDVCSSKRLLALQAGAVAVDRNALGMVLRRIKLGETEWRISAGIGWVAA